MAKKKLDELFKEKFTDFEQVPDDKVWQALEASLDKKKKRILPLWWKLAGAAAILAIGLLAINPFADPTEGEPALTNTDIQQNKVDSLEKYNAKETKILDTTDASETQLTEVNSQGTKENTYDNNEGNPSKNVTPDTKKDIEFSTSRIHKKKSQLTAIKEEEKSKSTSNKIESESNTGITDVDNEKSKKDPNPKGNLERLKENLQEDVAQKQGVKESITEKPVTGTIAQQESTSDAIKDEKDRLKEKVKQTGIVLNENERKDDDKVTDQSIKEDKKKSIFDVIEKQEEEVVAENDPLKRWSAGPSVAPVYFDAFGEGSPVHSILVPNSKSGDTNLSYGLSIAYAINDRLSVRSGLHKVDYGYDTGDIEFSSSLDGAITDQMENIDYAATARNLVVRSKAGSTAVSVSDSPVNQAFDAESANNSIARNGTMSQQLGYLEVPVELNYAIVDRKVGINIIGGFSSLFLVNNSVSLTAGDQTAEMGEANNVNNINFSTNIGLGLDYDFTSKIKLNIEPLFKYQLNTFSEVDGSFNPFSIGIYSGLTFKF